MHELYTDDGKHKDCCQQSHVQRISFITGLTQGKIAYSRRNSIHHIPGSQLVTAEGAVKQQKENMQHHGQQNDGLDPGETLSEKVGCSLQQGQGDHRAGQEQGIAKGIYAVFCIVKGKGRAKEEGFCIIGYVIQGKLNAALKGELRQVIMAEFQRIAKPDKIENGNDYDISACDYVTAVNRYGEDFYDTASDYVIREINGELYRFDYSVDNNDKKAELSSHFF